ncbi:hypothetical protein JHL17_05630 [Azospirillum sp. YIM B02556]|uniref:Uncharacterized protein n=1 Tax=Azospirillum endophyticum TaxID=2800326 RepID=A0ABS1F0E0_9PROT|nr:hypothetical protein [Azospirillum endophyticum]MBK1836887.1 hypothetical protein [Azospirillum endophyticum]
MPSYDVESAIFAAKFAIVRTIVCFALLAVFALISHVNANAILAADEATAAVALEMVRTMPVSVADASH